MPDRLKRLQKIALLSVILVAPLVPAAWAQNSVSQLPDIPIPTIPAPPADSINGSVVTAQNPTATAIPLTLNDAVRRGLKHNLDTVLAAENRKAASGERLKAVNFLMPTITWQAERSRNQIDLAAMGFRPGFFAGVPIGPGPTPTLPAVVTANVVSAQANLQQTLFNAQAIELYRAAKEEIRAVDFNFRSAQGLVLQTVIDSYLKVLADAANVTDAEELLATNQEILRQATLEHQAGTATKLDELRARVQYQRQQEEVLARKNTFEKAKVVLNRQIGLPADQTIRLTGGTPFAELTEMPLKEALRLAYRNRQQYLRLQAKLRSAQLQESAARYERLPTLSFHGNYGLTGAVGGVYHGTFLAEGTLTIPLYRESKIRGDRDVARAHVRKAEARLADFKTEIEAEIRDNMLDVASSKRLVDVSRSNVHLAHASLDDATVRFKNGIDDDLPVIQAQGALANAQAQLVQNLFQFNVAKIALARSIGVIAQQYRAYLGPAALHLSDSNTGTDLFGPTPGVPAAGAIGPNDLQSELHAPFRQP